MYNKLLLEKTILEFFSKLVSLEGNDFFRFLKFPALFSVLNRLGKGRKISKPGKNRGLETCSNIIFPLNDSKVLVIPSFDVRTRLKKLRQVQIFDASS